MIAKPRGFTLIEVLIVIAIIAVLSAIGLTIFRTAAKNARDSQRMKDLQNISSALGMYRYYAHSYPKAADFKLAPIPTPLIYDGKTFLNPVPKDADSARSYVYKTIPTNCDNDSSMCNGYALCARKEGSNDYKTSDCRFNRCGSGQLCDMEVSSP